jgi:hypothetical protein
MEYVLFDKETDKLKYTKFDMVIDNLYFDKSTIPSKEHILNCENYTKDKNIISYFKKHNNDPIIIIQDIKDNISKIDNKVPLYDEYTKNLYIIPKQYVHNKVVYESYRFPNKELKHVLKEKKNQLKEIVHKIKKNKELEKYMEHNLAEFEHSSLIHYNILHKKTSQIREYNKLVLMLNFLKQFNLSILETTYITVFYFYSNEAGKDITICKRPSFLPHFKHIDPYYKRGELINLALNMQLIKPDNKYYDQKEVMKLCTLITKNDISADTLLKHQEHIIKTNKIGVVRYYSLQGSYFINKYLRNLTGYENKILESIIISMYSLVNTAPAFDKGYTLYRFIENDSYLKHLKVGDKYIDSSFISTTRDPFHGSELYKFGFILIKIKIPAKVKGVGLCIETYSDFPNEQEIILAPFSELLLDKKDDDAIYYHHDNEKASKISTKYEFIYLGRQKLKFSKKNHVEFSTVDFLKIPILPTITLHEKIKIFMDTYVNEVYQVKTLINNKECTLIAEWYNSTSAYKEFYASTTSDGFSLYTIYEDYILFFIELAEENGVAIMYVNYYFSKSSAVGRNIIPDDDFIDFLAKLAYHFEIEHVFLFASYESCDNNKLMDSGNIQIYRGGSFCVDFYRYLKYNEKRFKIDPTELKTKFSYYQLDRLRTLDPMLILNKSDPNEMYQIYKKTYKILVEPSKHNLADFYIWLVENQCVQLEFLTQNMYKIYEVNNPFVNDYYVLDPGAYLNNRNLISDYPIFKKKKEPVESIGSEITVNKNNYRLDTNRRLKN